MICSYICTALTYFVRVLLLSTGERRFESRVFLTRPLLAEFVVPSSIWTVMDGVRNLSKRI